MPSLTRDGADQARQISAELAHDKCRYPVVALFVSCEAALIQLTDEGAVMNNKRTYEKPVLQSLGLLRRLTKFSFGDTHLG